MATPEPAEPPIHPIRAWKEIQTLQHQLGLLPATAHKAPPQNDVVFLSLDCEAYEHAQHKITELGISTLDTRDLANLSHSDSESAWTEKIRSAHFRPVEHAKLVNKKFLRGCPERFNFGITRMIRLSEAERVLRRVFRAPGLLLRAHEPVEGEVESAFASAERREVVLVGHGLGNDRKYLRQLGFDLATAAPGLKTADTQVLAGSTKKVTVGLARLLKVLGVEARDLHNAGNDAAYTLWALVLKARMDFLKPGAVERELGVWVKEVAEKEGLAPRAVYRDAGERKEAKRRRRAERLREREGNSGAVVEAMATVPGKVDDAATRAEA
ncbi:hypothetical protein MBLNU230_g3723t1 [Neophaeotheca triangularis]